MDKVLYIGNNILLSNLTNTTFTVHLVKML